MLERGALDVQGAGTHAIVQEWKDEGKWHTSLSKSENWAELGDGEIYQDSGVGGYFPGWSGILFYFFLVRRDLGWEWLLQP